jgi:CHAT domain-containing protein
MRQALEKASRDPDLVTIATDPTAIPANLGVYQAIAWSGHASSNPTNWEESHLALDAAKITAKQILQEWRLANTCVAILSACETGIDKSIDDEIDDYLGIDMAVHVAGANNVVSTMWPVEDRLAGLVSAFLAEGVVKHAVPPAEFLRRIRFDLMSGEWKAKVESNYATLTTDQKRAHAARFSMLLEADKDAFRGIGAWGVYRTFGG